MQRVAAPDFIEPMKAKLTQHLPSGPEWMYEIKWDGYRALLAKRDGALRMRSRNDNDLSHDFPSLLKNASEVSARSALIDGELVALDSEGRPSFELLGGGRKPAALVYYAFDLLELNGKPLISQPLEVRRQSLQRILKGDTLRFSGELNGSAEAIVTMTAELGLEGIVAKRRGSQYVAGDRSGLWLKFKIGQRQEFVIGGYRPNGRGLEAIVVGYYENRALRFASVVKQGYTPMVRNRLLELLKPESVEECQFSDLPTSKKGRFGEGIPKEKMSEYVWLKPTRVAEVAFASWTNHGHLRHAIFKGIRSDKAPSTVQRERPEAEE